MIWLILLLLVILIFGLGTILEAAFGLLVILAVIGIAAVYFGARRLRRRH